jgi:hypothetical protein
MRVTRAKARRLVLSLARAVCAGTTLAWAVAHAPTGRDPLPAAWARCRDAGVMHTLLWALNGEQADGLPRPHRTRWARVDRHSSLLTFHRRRHGCRRLRRHRALTLATVLEARRG